MKWNVGTNIGAGFALTLVIFVMAGFFSYRSIAEMADAAQWRKHTYDVLAEITNLELHLKNLEGGPRAYALTGIRADYLKGITDDRVVVLDLDRILSDPKIVVHDEVET